MPSIYCHINVLLLQELRFYLYTVNLPMWSPLLIDCIKKSRLSCTVTDKCIWIKDILRNHLSCEATFPLSKRWPLNTGLTNTHFGSRSICSEMNSCYPHKDGEGKNSFKTQHFHYVTLTWQFMQMMMRTWQTFRTVHCFSHICTQLAQIVTGK